MPVSRMRMRPWLEKMIDSNSISGLHWVDKDKTMFSIPWKHAARHGWEIDKDACLFKKWAIHTGKYTEGQVSDPKTWKANFRCAMNSLPDIEEVKDKSINKGHQAVRVFRMLPATPKSRDKRTKAKETKQRIKNSVDEVNVKVTEDTFSTQESTVDSTVNTEQEEGQCVGVSDVSEVLMSVEDLGSSLFSRRFEVSPEHFMDYECPDEIVQICQQLEKEQSHFMFGSLDDRGFLSNEACTSPGSQWSDSSSADELDDTPQYTNLGTDSISTDEIWHNFCQQIPPYL